MCARLEVFNLPGWRIVVVADEDPGAPFHATVWDATDTVRAGIGLATGLSVLCRGRGITGTDANRSLRNAGAVRCPRP